MNAPIKPALLLFVFTAALSNAAQGQSAYTFSIFDFPNAGGTGTVATGVNNAGDVVGYYYDTSDIQHGFVWAKGGMKTVDFPLSQARTSLYGVNNCGSVVGQIFLETQGTTQSFVLEGGEFTIVNYAGSVFTQAYGINDQDTVSGTYQLGTQDYGFQWSQGQFFTVSLPTQHAAWVTGLNDLGDVVGYYFEGKGSDQTNSGFAYIKKTNERFTLSFPGALNTSAMAINNLGQIVGSYQLSSQSNLEAFLYADGVYTAIGPFANGAVAWGINDAGVIVGQLGQPYGGWLGFVATPVASGGLRDSGGPSCGQQ